MLKLAFLPIYEFPVKKETYPPLPGADHGPIAGLLIRSAVFRENSKWWTKIHSRLTSLNVSIFFAYYNFLVLIEYEVI